MSLMHWSLPLVQVKPGPHCPLTHPPTAWVPSGHTVNIVFYTHLSRLTVCRFGIYKWLLPQGLFKTLYRLHFGQTLLWDMKEFLPNGLVVGEGQQRFIDLTQLKPAPQVPLIHWPIAVPPIGQTSEMKLPEKRSSRLWRFLSITLPLIPF